jgi:non-specific protein-tyrosine kinase
MNDFVELRRVFAVIMSRPWLVIGATLAGVLVGLLISRGQTPVYQATTTMLVGQFMQSTTVSRTDMQTSVDAAKMYADLALRQPVLDSVVSALELDMTWQQLKKQVRVKAVEGTQLIEVTVEANSPEAAQDIANQVAAQLITISPTTGQTQEDRENSEFVRRQLDNLKQKLEDAQIRVAALDSAIAASTSETEKAGLQAEKSALENSIIEWEQNFVSLSNLLHDASATNNYLAIIEPAQATSFPVRPRTSLDMAVGGGVGLILALALLFFLEYIRDTFRSPEEIHQVKDLPVLGVVGKISGTQPADRIVAYQKPFSPVTESYRMIRNKIQFRSGDVQPIRSILVTSPSPGDGKSVTAVNLAVIMAKAGHRTILVDTDLSQPVLHEMFNVDKYMGLADMLDPHETDYDRCIKDTFIRTLRLVTSGTPISDPSERISTERTAEVMKQLEQRADIVIFDSPPVLLAADAAILAGYVDGVIMVLRAGKTTRSDVRRAILELENVDANLLGCILNGANSSGNRTYTNYRKQSA